jgi:5'-nucleotidase/UDP-sugar diphosphatase
LNKLIQLFTVVLCLSFSQKVLAKKFMIIHTNDLHSYFDGLSEKVGSYARLKTIIDSLKLKAKKSNMPVIVTDGGDWGEGTSFFYTNEGVASIKLLEKIGVEYAVIGNHDHIQGGSVLASQLERAKVKTKFLSANILLSKEIDFNQKVSAHSDFKIGKFNARIIGLSTDDLHHQGAIIEENGKIADPIAVGCKLAKKAKRESIDIVIALTHIGIKKDKKLAKKCKEFDLILGGHSHTRLNKVVMKKKTPIIQTGAHTKAVGQLIVDYDERKDKLKVIEYKLVDASDLVKKDKSIKNYVDEVKNQRNELFDGMWDKVIGKSNIRLFGYKYKRERKRKEKNCWSDHMAKILADATKSDFGVNLIQLAGKTIPKGNITYGNIVDNAPHFRSFSDQGWEIGVIKGPGKIIKKVVKLLTLLGKHRGLSVHNVKIRGIRVPTTEYVLPIWIRKIKKNKVYSIALPAELSYAMQLMAPKQAKELMPFYKGSGKYFWTEMADYIKDNSPLNCLK